MAVRVGFLFFSFLIFFVGGVHASDSTTFIYCSEGSPSTFNPQLATDGTTFNASGRTVFNRLVEFEVGGTKLLPSLAESWEISKDGRDYTFHLRKYVHFHTRDNFTPTRDFNADDVVFSLARMKDKTHPYHKVSGGTYEYFQAMEMDTLIEFVQKLDEHTVKFHLKKAQAPFLANLAMDFASIFSAEYADKMLVAKTPEIFDMEPVGTGPFIFRSYVKDTLIRYKAFENHFGGAPEIKKLIFVITPDASVRFQKLKTGECHLIGEPAPQDLRSMAEFPDIQVASQPGLNVGYLAMNVTKPPFNRLEVRKAVAMALNRKLYLDAIYQGTATLAKNPLPPRQWSYNESTPEDIYNPEKAKTLLRQAGFANGFEAELWTLPVARPYNPNGKKMGELMQADLAKVGIRVKLVTYDWPTYLAKARRGEHQMLQMGWTGDNGDPDNFLNVLLGCGSVHSGANQARWCDKEFNDLVSKAAVLNDQKQRAVLYEKAQLRFKSQVPWVTLAHAQVFRAMSKSVQGYHISPFGLEVLWPVKLSAP